MWKGMAVGRSEQRQWFVPSEGERIAQAFVSRATVLLILATAAVILCWDIAKPWTGYQSTTGGEFGIMARNYLRYGYVETKLGPVTNVGPATRGQWRYYTHHPVILPVLISLSYRLFGIHEVSARLIPVVFTLAGLFVYYRIVAMQWNPLTARWALFFVALAPMTTFFGSTIEYEPLSICFVMMTLWCYLRWLRTASAAAYAGMMFSVLAGGLSDWAAYFIVPWLILHCLLHGGATREQCRKILILPVVAFVGITIVLTQLWAIGGAERLLEIFGTLTYRTGITPNTGPHSPTGEDTSGFPAKLILTTAYGVYLFTPIMVGLSGLWLARFLRKIVRRETLGNDGLVIMLLGFGLSYTIACHQAAIHPYFLMNLGPFMGLSAALAVIWGYDWLAHKNRGHRVAMAAALCAVFSVLAVTSTLFLRTFLEADDLGLYQLGLWIRDNSPADARLLVLKNGRQRDHFLLDYYAERDMVLISPEGVGMGVVPGIVSPEIRYVIVSNQSSAAGVTEGLPKCNWPPLEGYTCFDTPQDSRITPSRATGWSGGMTPQATGSGVRARGENNLLGLLKKKFDVFFERKLGTDSSHMLTQ